MGISFSHILLSCIALCLGYYIKARFEINQEQLIEKLELEIEKIKTDSANKIEKVRYNLWQVEQVRDRLHRDFLEFKEKTKNESFNSIPKEELETENQTRDKVLKSFL